MRVSMLIAGLVATAAVVGPATAEEGDIWHIWSLGGGGVTPVTPPVSVRLELRDSTGTRLAPLRAVAPGVEVRLDLPVLAQPGELPGAFAWLRALYEGGTFQGYLRMDAPFDAGTGMLTATVPLLFGEPFLENGKLELDLPLIGDVGVTSGLAFDVGVYLVVVGLVFMVFEAFGGYDRTRTSA